MTADRRWARGSLLAERGSVGASQGGGPDWRDQMHPGPGALSATADITAHTHAQLQRSVNTMCPFAS